MRAVVTAAGTSEPIDDVRVVTNLSTGRFGAAIANALAARGLEVTLLAGRALDRRDVDPDVAVVPFGSFLDLARGLDDALARPPRLVFMAAAVSDYSPERQPGKIRSDRETFTVVFRRNPKLLSTLRPRCPDAFLIGFKLLSGVGAPELVDAARGLLRRDRLDRVVANDLAELGGAEHPVTFVSEAGERRIAGPRERVAGAIVDEALAALPTREAASACLWHRASDQVLIGRRKTSSWHGFWAFPGGASEPGETPRTAALRELREETGLGADGGEIVGESTVYAGDGPCWRIHNVAIAVPEARDPRETDELAARWVPRAEAAALSPMAAGSRRILRRLAAIAGDAGRTG